MLASYHFAFGLDISRADAMSLLIYAFIFYVLIPLLIVLAAAWSFYLFKRYAKRNLSPKLLRFNIFFSIVFLILVLVTVLIGILLGSDKL